ncbi:MAG: hypothetical protein KDD58_08875 [Bdellovibrionales bacterium]|nr:hypothetical protein [Bdellovibrionales bacterium]
MTEEDKNLYVQDAYQPEYYSLTPTKMVRFFRVFWPWQILRFIFINIKMVKMIGKSHAKKTSL